MAQPGKREEATAALLGGFCLFLSTLEYLIPKPLPFMRLGLANVPLMLALDIVRLKYLALLVLIKILGQAIISGTLVSYICVFSLASTCAATTAMYLLRRLFSPKHLSFIGISVIGALCSNGAQLILAQVFIFGSGVQFLVPPFLIAGIITGTSLGIFCETFISRSRWYHQQIRPAL
ncbi:MAG: Gx transporter family protein [Treponema sp.]|jgi:heptaprenyl diphosphate synthase|nr:Gx transporter family protein [Treponema sp.]